MVDKYATFSMLMTLSFASSTADKLQALLDTVHNWCFLWKMKLNYNKSNVMHFRTSRRSRTTVPFNFGTTALTTVVISPSSGGSPGPV